MRLLVRKPERGDERLSALVLEPDEGRVRIFAGRRGPEDVLEHLVEVDAAAELPEHTVPPQLLLRLLARTRELLGQLVDPLVERPDQVGDALVGPSGGPTDQRDRRHQRDDDEPGQQPDEKEVHRRRFTPPSRTEVRVNSM
jgi:hypothetical protein